MGSANFFFVVLAAAASLLAVQGSNYGDYPTANLSTLWINNKASLPNGLSYMDGTTVRAIVLRSPRTQPFSFDGWSFAAGFFCASPCDVFLFSVFIVSTDSGGWFYDMATGPQVVWSANRASPVRENATLELTRNGNLILHDADGRMVWSSGTSDKSVAGMEITKLGNLVLFDQRNATVWQSFDHPTDSLVPGQSLLQGSRLTANTSATNSTQNQLYYITVLSDGLYGYVESTPPQLYFSYAPVQNNKTRNDPTKVTFKNGSLSIIMQSSEPSDIFLPPAPSSQYMRLEYDGHLRLHQWSGNVKQWTLSDVMQISGDCAYPTVCGEYGICTNGQCTCPLQSNTDSTYFKPVDERKANLGCMPVIPISCQDMQHHELFTLTDVSYFDERRTVVNLNRNDCKQACLNNCSCRAVVFRYGQGDSNGECFWVTKVFSLQSIQPKALHYNSTAYIKVQLSPSNSSSAPAARTNRRKVMLAITLTTTSILVLLLVIVAILYLQRRKYEENDEDSDFDQLSGMPARFPLEKLRECTEGFSKKLGEGGFGSVFEGKLDEERVAVKRLEGARQGKKEFLAEVETIGSIEHINLVKLIGFCAEKSERLLVYEYMSRGSLDRWIYNRHNNTPLDWFTRFRIILDIAKGLCYLHEGCRRKIAHLDIKPQNILLDENFNAKVADFGLSKLIDRDQSKVVTMMRGTPGYLAPEWLTSQITEKVDVYSFGVVILEIISGRKSIDRSQPEENLQLINLLREKAQHNQWIDLIDKKSDDMVSRQEEAIQMMKLAIWCLQNDSSHRPTMSTVIKVLEGTVTVETRILQSFLNANSAMSVQDNPYPYSVPSQASILSGPR